MQELITSYLVQKRECNLPLLGHFRIKTKPAETDIANKEIFPQSDEILYSEFAGHLSAGLVSYISNLQSLNSDDTEKKINEWCIHARMKLDAGEEIHFNSVGSLQKDGTGNIFFKRKPGFLFYEPLHAERVIHKNAEHAMLVGDKETTSGAMNEFFSEEIVEKKQVWKKWAIVLLSASILFLIFYFIRNGFSESAIGSGAPVPASDPPVLHYSPE